MPVVFLPGLVRSLAGPAGSFVTLAGLVLACAASGPAHAQEALDAREARGSILRIQRLSADDGWVLTDAALLVTRDGGATWSNKAPRQPLDGVTDAFFVDDAHGWLAGVAPDSPGHLVVADTSDGGTSWRERRVGASALPAGRTYARAQVHFFDAAHGWLLGQAATSTAFSLGELLRTTDGGASWERLPRPPAAGRFVFVDGARGFMAGSPVSERLYGTRDGGRSWQDVNLGVSVGATRALYALPVFRSATEGTVAVTLPGRMPRLLTFVTSDGGSTWRPAASIALPVGDYDQSVPAAIGTGGRPTAFAARGSITFPSRAVPRTLSLAREQAGRGPAAAGATPSVLALSAGDGAQGWALLAEGACDANSCRQVTRLVAWDGSGRGAAHDLLVRTETFPPATLPPPEFQPQGATISFDKGFDQCAAATTAQMQTWKAFSPYKDANIYYGGAARACSQVNLSASWVSTVFGQGWRLVPTWVGPQAPCTSFGTRFSSDPSTARNQGLSEADAAVSGAAALGLGAGTPLYYDLELYAESNAPCSAAVRAFVDAWSERVTDRGYLAGVYGNARNAQADWIAGAVANPPDAVWLTPWVCGSTASCNWSPTVFGIPGLSDAYWASSQRIRQYWGAHNETYGGVTFNVDSDYANGPVATNSAPSSCLASVPVDRWKGEYFANQTLSGTPAMVRDDGTASLSFDWSTGTPSSACGIPADHFSVRWTRTLAFAAGTYRFNTRTDDGVRLYVDDVLRIDKWIDRAAPPTPDTVDVTLAAGNHTLRLEYYENGGLASAELTWQGASTSLPVFDAASSAAAATADLTWSHTVSGSDPLLLVGASIRGNVPITSVSYGGVALTKIRHDTFGTDVRSELWYLAGPPVGPHDVHVLLSSPQSVIAGATSWSNVDPANPLGSHVGANHGGTAGTTASVQLASGPDQIVVDVVATQAAGATVTPGSLQVVRWNRQGANGNGGGSSQPGAAAVTMAWTLAIPEFWAISAVALRAAGPTPTLVEWPNAESAANSDPWLSEHHAEIERLRPRVLALNFVNKRSMDQMRAQLQQVIDAVAEGSRYHGYADAGAPAFLQYQLAYAVDMRDPVPPANYPYNNSTLYPRQSPVQGAWGFDYGRLFTPEYAQHYDIRDPNNPARVLGLCEAIDQGLVHEIWVYGDADVPDVNAAEILEQKPVYDENRQRVPGQMNRCAGNGCFDPEDNIPCTRTVRIAFFNNTRGAGCFLESLSHGLESTGGSPTGPIPYLRRYFIPFASFDLDTRYGLPFRNWYACPYNKLDCLSYPSETSVTYDTGTASGNVGDYDPVCGNAHFPPNARGQYDTASPYTVRTSCANYRDGSGQTMEFTSQQLAPYANLAPDCTGPWQVWWYQNIPGLDNASRDDAGEPMLSWWPFLFY